MVELRDQIIETMDAKGITQTRAGEMLGKTQSEVSAQLRKATKRGMTEAELIRYAAVCGKRFILVDDDRPKSKRPKLK